MLPLARSTAVPLCGGSMISVERRTDRVVQLSEIQPLPVYFTPPASRDGQALASRAPLEPRTLGTHPTAL
jgi:hypothetical protein